jgi:hypothetical protein
MNNNIFTNNAYPKILLIKKKSMKMLNIFFSNLYFDVKLNNKKSFIWIKIVLI